MHFIGPHNPPLHSSIADPWSGGADGLGAIESFWVACPQLVLKAGHVIALYATGASNSKLA